MRSLLAALALVAFVMAPSIGLILAEALTARLWGQAQQQGQEVTSMAGRPAYDRSTYRTDLKALRRRGLSIDAAARSLGMSRATAYRILNDD